MRNLDNLPTASIVGVRGRRSAVIVAITHDSYKEEDYRRLAVELDQLNLASIDTVLTRHSRLVFVLKGPERGFQLLTDLISTASTICQRLDCKVIVEETLSAAVYHLFERVLWRADMADLTEAMSDVT